MIFHQAADFWIHTVDAVTALAQLAAGLAVILLCALALCVAPGARTARRGLTWAQASSRVSDAPEVRPRRPVPSWALSQPRAYDEAA